MQDHSLPRLPQDHNHPPRRSAYIGRAVTRLEDRPLVLGAGRFVGDMDVPHQLWARVVRSAHAVGRIAGIDTSAARAMPGVAAVWTAEDLGNLPHIPFRATKIEGLDPYTQPCLAKDRVRYVGEPVAIVFAEDPYLAEDAAEAVFAEIDEDMAPILDARAEPGEFAPGHSSAPLTLTKGYGDVDAAFAGAAHVVELDLAIGRHSGIPMETRGALAAWDHGRERLDLWGATKRPHWNRDRLAEMFGLSPSQVALHEPHVGGGFGIRGELYPEDILVCLAAMRLGRPVKWVEDRREHMMAANQSREQQHLIRAAVDAEGRLLAIDETLHHDQGAYVRTHGARVADMSIGLLLGPYRVPAYAARAHFRLTAKTPAATYRAPSRFESTFVRERLMDAIATRTGLDPLDLRRRNFIASSEMPFDRHMTALESDVILDSGDYEGLLGKAAEFCGLDALRAEAAERRAKGECVGVGLGYFVEKSGLGPSELVRLTVHPDGGIEIVTGAASLGQGMETAVAQIAADTLGADYQACRVIHGDTDRISHGWGAHASRVTVMTGEATRRAAETVRAKACEMAASLLDCTPDAINIDGGIATCRTSDASVTLAEIAAALDPVSPKRGDRDPGLAAEAWYHNKHMNYPYGAHVALVIIDRDTGHVRLDRYWITYDVGRAINPAMIEGQIVGGLAQGLGGALLEEFRFDDQGQPLSVTFADYLMPTSAEMPDCRVQILQDAPSPLNPLGIKGSGEAGVTGAGAAIACAIDDALQRPGLVTRLPVTPQYLRARIAEYDAARAGDAI
ncbi:xanthine dehydrogenase family protein molybdopterin-binding subunit [Salipiger marinus]|uniref:Xanthine dehydrogenase, molybdenum binding subunit apoprotein n=1 Tax=Salipiger marinus TaxID=555512 RepID=A0A1G8M543_9RHOB|nr:xanthine dehydrogenase family protein molybdopterin-binding subunit [Salipiger marinus]SDI63015.1 xanthine dehydrogenase, molybdenum binding subunit apoprotein [Salipiger marinus]